MRSGSSHSVTAGEAGYTIMSLLVAAALVTILAIGITPMLLTHYRNSRFTALREMTAGTMPEVVFSFTASHAYSTASGNVRTGLVASGAPARDPWGDAWSAYRRTINGDDVTTLTITTPRGTDAGRISDFVNALGTSGYNSIRSVSQNGLTITIQYYGSAGT
jgi:hypothetical protein